MPSARGGMVQFIGGRKWPIDLLSVAKTTTGTLGLLTHVLSRHLPLKNVESTFHKSRKPSNQPRWHVLGMLPKRNQSGFSSIVTSSELPRATVWVLK